MLSTMLALDLYDTAMNLVVDFGHVWVPLPTNTWFRPGATKPIIDPNQSAYFMLIRGQYVKITQFDELPDTDIYNHKGLVVRREIVKNLRNNPTIPVQALDLISRHLDNTVAASLSYRTGIQALAKNVYRESILDHRFIRTDSLDLAEFDSVQEAFDEAFNSHWYEVMGKMFQQEQMVKNFVMANPWCQYRVIKEHTEMIIERGIDIRIEFFNRYQYLEDKIEDLHRKTQEEQELTREK